MGSFFKDMLKISFIPNYLTLGNLLCGVFALYFIMQDNINGAIILLLGALLFDFLDGAVARGLKITSSLGKELDSLSDAVSFGVVPAFMIIVFIFDKSILGFFVGGISACFALLRLARFNIIENKGFIGMPTPIFAIFVAVYSISAISLAQLVDGLILIAASVLMVSDIPFPTFKQKKFLIYKISAIVLFGLLPFFWNTLIYPSLMFVIMLVIYEIRLKKLIRKTFYLFLAGFLISIFAGYFLNVPELLFLYSCIAALLVREK
jgi:CDP-diacylglycerol---serine O-phosphatidyltransferase